MQIFPLTSEARQAAGFTHKAVITYLDVAALNTATTVAGAIVLLPYIAGTLFDKFAFRLVTVFTDAAATLSSLTMQVGWNGATTDDPDGLLAATELEATGTEILAGDGNGAAFATLRTGYLALDAGNIEATFIPTFASGTGEASLTDGEVHLYLSCIDLTKL